MSQQAVSFFGTGATIPWYGTAASPTAIYVGSTQTTWIAWEGWSGSTRMVYVTTYDHSASSWGETYVAATDTLTDDDHGAPALVRDGDGYVHLFYGSHNSNQKYASTDAVDDPSAWTRRSSLSGDYTYPAPVLVGSTIYLFLRRTDTDRPLTVRVSDTLSGGVATWDSDVDLTAPGGSRRSYHGEPIVDGTDIHIPMTVEDSGLREHVYWLVYDTTNGSVSNIDGSTTVTSANLPLDLTDLNTNFRVVDSGTDRTDIPAACIDTSGNVHILYPLGSGAGATDLLHRMWDGSSWSSATTVGTVYATTAGYVELTALSVLPSGEVAAIWPEDSAGDWTKGGEIKRRVRASGGTWGTTETLLEPVGAALSIPYAIQNAHADARMIVSERAQSEDDVDAGGHRGWMYGASGFVDGPDREVDEHWDEVVTQIHFVGADGKTQALDERKGRTVTFAGSADITDDALQTTTNDYASLPDHDDWTPTGDFCFEVFGARFDVDDENSCLLGHWSASLDNRSWLIQYQGAAGTPYLAFWSSADGSASAARVQHTWTPTIGQRYDIAAEREGDVFRLYIDGTEVASSTVSTTFHNSNAALTIGANNVGGTATWFKGSIEAIRMVKGSVRYGGTSYTPATLPLPNQEVGTSALERSVTITRTTDGLVFRDDFDRADEDLDDSADWTAHSNYKIVSGQLEHASTSGLEKAEVAGVSRDELVVQVEAQRKTGTASSINPILIGRQQAGTINGYAAQMASFTGTGQLRLTRITGGSTFTQLAQAQSDTHAPTGSGSWRVLKVYAADGVQKAWINEALPLSAADTTYNADPGTGGLTHGGSGETLAYREFIICKKNSVLVTGLQNGEKAKIRDGTGTVVKEATESGGTATIDLAEKTTPYDGFADLVVTDANDQIQGTYDAEGIYPGGEYNAETVAAATEVTPTTAQSVTTAPDPTVAAGASVQPTTAESATTAPDPTAQVGLSVTPTTAETVSEAPDPTVAAGASTQPTTAETVTEAPDPTVTVVADVLVEPTTAETVSEALDPTVETFVLVLPDTAETETEALDPAVSVEFPAVPEGTELAIWDVAASDWLGLTVAADGGWRQTRSPITPGARSYNRRLARRALTTRNRIRTVQVRTPWQDRADAITLIDQLRQAKVREIGGSLVGDTTSAVVSGIRLRQNEASGIAAVECQILFEGTS